RVAQRADDLVAVGAGHALHVHLRDRDQRGVAEPEEVAGQHRQGDAQHRQRARGRAAGGGARGPGPRRRGGPRPPPRRRGGAGGRGPPGGRPGAGAGALAGPRAASRGGRPGAAPPAGGGRSLGAPGAHTGGFPGPGRDPCRALVGRRPSGHSTSPSTCTSGSSSIPKRSDTRRRPSAMSRSTSAVVAWPRFSTKFACFGAKRAPPTRIPAQPAAASSSPAVRPEARGSPGSGFLNVEPKVLIPDGWASRRRARISASVALIRSGSPSARRKVAWDTTSPGRRLELR